jgi:hypothetical protein
MYQGRATLGLMHWHNRRLDTSSGGENSGLYRDQQWKQCWSYREKAKKWSKLVRQAAMTGEESSWIIFPIQVVQGIGKDDDRL